MDITARDDRTEALLWLGAIAATAPEAALEDWAAAPEEITEANLDHLRPNPGETATALAGFSHSA
jgi:hypothetical protein